MRGNNFLLTILRLAKERDELRIVDDQIGAPTWCRMLAEATALILARGEDGLADKFGLYHLTAGGTTSWYGFAKAVLDSHYGECETPRIFPIDSTEYKTLAKRPTNSLLSTDKLTAYFKIYMPYWDNALRQAMSIDQ
jgi:dTDP-4-dehydrorhamnose reductase